MRIVSVLSGAGGLNLGFKFAGNDIVWANDIDKFAMRTDIHTLFDTGHLRISGTGVIELSNRARLDYGRLFRRELLSLNSPIVISSAGVGRTITECNLL